MNNFTGTLNAIMEQEDDKWRLFSVNFVVLPDKLKAWGSK